MTLQPSRPSSTGKLFAKLSRPQNVLYPATLLVVCGYTHRAHLIALVTAIVALFSLYSLAATLNNIVDQRIDRLNHRVDNPLASHFIPHRWLIGFAACQVIVLAAVQIGLRQPTSALLCLLYLGLLIAYSYPKLSLQSRGIAATITLAICYGMLPVLLGGAQASTPRDGLLFVSVSQVLLLAPLLLAKDYKDVAGDQAGGKRTPLVRYGKRGVIIASGVSLAIYVCLLAISAAHTMTGAMILVASFGYMLLVGYIHHCNGRQPLIYTRLTQLILVAISYLMLQSIS